MPIARAELIEPTKPGFYHCISRCVRRAFLCGGPRGEYDHRRDWLEKRLRELTAIFAIDIIAYAIMGNHVHVLLWTDPERSEQWDDLEIARRWLTVFPGPARSRAQMSVKERAKQLAADPNRVAELRRRLASLSWFNRCLKEPLARLANAEDGCTGVFWEGRFKSYRVTGESGALKCALYIDLNPIRAGVASTPESSRHASVKQRIDEYRRSRKHDSRGGRKSVSRQATGAAATGSRNHGCWLTPFGRKGVGQTCRRALFEFGHETYIRLVDEVGRRIRSGRHRAIPTSLRPILERLEEDMDECLAGLRLRLEQLWGTTIGSQRGLAEEAIRRERRWVVDPLRPPG